MMWQDMPLDERQAKEVAHWKKQYGQERGEARERWLKSKSYVETFLKCENRTTDRQSNCYATGRNTYSRNDEQAITQDDLDALLAQNLSPTGGYLENNGGVGQKFIVMTWVYDTTD